MADTNSKQAFRRFVNKVLLTTGGIYLAAACPAPPNDSANEISKWAPPSQENTCSKSIAENPAGIPILCDASVSDAKKEFAEKTLERVGYPFHDVLEDWTILIKDGDLLNKNGGTAKAESKILTIYINDNSTPQGIVDVIIHEIGHAIDGTFLDDNGRRFLLALMGDPHARWRDSSGMGFTYNEWFAECFVEQQTGRAPTLPMPRCSQDILYIIDQLSQDEKTDVYITGPYNYGSAFIKDGKPQIFYKTNPGAKPDLNYCNGYSSGGPGIAAHCQINGKEITANPKIS